MAPEEMETLVTFPIESGDQRRLGRAARPIGDRGRHRRRVGGVRLGHRHLSGAAGGRGEAGAGQRQRCRRRSSGRCWRRSRRSWARSCSSRSPRTHDDPLTLRTVADTVVRRRLLAVPGVSQVTPIGGAERQFQVIAHPDQLRANDIRVDRAARRRARRQPEHVGRHLHRGPAGVRAADDRPRRARRRRSATAWSRCAATGRCWSATSPTCAKARRSSAARARATASPRSSSACRSSRAPTPSSSPPGSIASSTRSSASCRAA